MKHWLEPISTKFVEQWENDFNNWFLAGALVFLALEFIRYGLLKKISKDLVGDTVTNFATLVFFLLINVFVLGSIYVFAVYGAYQNALFSIETNFATVLICILLADLLYYWEHRCMHRFNFAWATHTVHHSSPHFNMSVAYRFGPMDGFWPMGGTIIMAFLGFNPVVIAFAELFVQLYQTALHTETIKKLPRPIEAIMNTPSHHRVHHGSNEEYLDTNYGGIFIIWDRMFGTFALERAPVVYGLTHPIESVNPLTVFFHGFYRLGKNVIGARGWRNRAGYFFGPPDFQPGSYPNHDAAQAADSKA